MDPRIQRVIALMDQKPEGRLTLAAMARIAGLSSSRLRHKFKSEVGVTPTAYLQMLRLHKARKLLTTGNLTVKEVKASVGITSDSYFTHQFKRAFGIPPSRSKAGIIEPMAQIESTISDSIVSKRREVSHRDIGILTKEPFVTSQHCEAPTATVEMEFNEDAQLGFETCVTLSVEPNVTSVSSGSESTVYGFPRVH